MSKNAVPGQPVDTNALLGRGIVVFRDSAEIMFLFEAAGMAEDQQGRPAPAGLSMRMQVPPDKIKTIAEYEAIAEKWAREGIASMAFEPGILSPLTLAEYRERGYEE